MPTTITDKHGFPELEGAEAGDKDFPVSREFSFAANASNTLREFIYIYIFQFARLAARKQTITKEYLPTQMNAGPLLIGQHMTQIHPEYGY